MGGRRGITGAINALMLVLLHLHAQANGGKSGNRNLSCHSCSYKFTRKYNEMRKCHKPTGGFETCTGQQKFCMIKEVSTYGYVQSRVRMCAEKCFGGCDYRGFGIVQKTCVTCCSTYKCNNASSSTAPIVRINFADFIFSALSSLSIITQFC